MTSRCPHLPLCGGCSKQHLDYGAQLSEKQTLIDTLFAPWLQDGTIEHYPIIGSEDPWYYRNKMEFSFSQNLAGDHFLGLMQRGGRRRVENLNECHLTPLWFVDVLKSVREWWKKSGVLAYHTFKDTGALRTLTVREGRRTRDKMAILTVSGNPAFALSSEAIAGFTAAVKSALPEGENPSLFLRIQQIQKGSPTQFYEMHLSGPDHIKEMLGGLKFKISPTSFFQPHTVQAEKLYARARELSQLHKEMTVYDLYCGTASISMAFAPHVKKVIGIELNPHAIFDAKENLVLNQIDNVELHIGDVGKVLQKLKADSGFTPPDLVIVDPPRSGLDPLALSHLFELAPKQILYISCNPHTQVENIKNLYAAGYTLKAIQPVDQFPHTAHLENIALLHRVP